ncbi:MAG: Spy/CpxP family protein refolding chaperone [Thermoguttaceae bacterium]
MRLVSTLLALLVSLTVVGNLSAADEKQKPEGRRAAQRSADPVDAMLHGITLTDEQKAKVDELKVEYGPKLIEARQKVSAGLTDEQKKARNEAAKAARDAGKTPQETRKDIEASLNLTDDQKAQMAEAQKEFASLRKEVQKKAMAILTPEQQEQLKAARHGHRHGQKAENR